MTEIQKRIFDQIVKERNRQDQKFGIQNHSLERWITILTEETGEVARSVLDNKPEELKEELIQVAAVAIAILENIQDVLNVIQK